MKIAIATLVAVIVWATLTLTTGLSFSQAATTAPVLHASGTIRCSGGVWSAINDSGHEPYGIGSISVVGNFIQVNYTSAMTEVSSVQVTADNDYNGEQVTAGASGSLGYTRINLRKGGAVVSPASVCDNPYTNSWITAWDAF